LSASTRLPADKNPSACLLLEDLAGGQVTARLASASGPVPGTWPEPGPTSAPGLREGRRYWRILASELDFKRNGIFGFGNIVPGAYTPVLAKHSKHFSLEDSLAIGVDRMQRNFGPLKQQVEEWQALQLSTAAAKLLIYQAFIEEESGFPKHLARRVHDLYFQPVHEEFQARTMWSLSNAFTSAFKELEPIPQYKATAKLAGFLQSVRPQ